MKVPVLYYNTWPDRDLQLGESESFGSFEAHDHEWHAVRDPSNIEGVYSIAHKDTGYVLSGVLKLQPEAAIEAAKLVFQKQTKEQIDVVIRAVKEATGAPIR